MTARLPLLLLMFTLNTVPAPAHAAQEVPVDLRLDAGPQLKAERTMKSLLDEWSSNAFDVRFRARPELSFATPGLVRVRLDGLAIAFRADWYRRYKAFHDDLVKRPYGPEILANALAYCRQGDARLQATVYDAAGKAIWSGPVTHTRAPSHYAPIEAHFFTPTVRRALPAAAPDLRQLWQPPPGEAPYVVTPAEVARAAKRIRLGDMIGRRWPVDLRDPLAAPAQRPAAPTVPAEAGNGRPGAAGAPDGAPAGAPGGAPTGGPGGSPGGQPAPTPPPSDPGAAPRLPPPALAPDTTATPRPGPTARVAPPRRYLR